MQNNKPHLVLVPGTQKTINLQELFRVIAADYGSKLDSIDFITEEIEHAIRYVSGSITNETCATEITEVFGTLYNLKDIFKFMEIKD